MTKSHRNLWRLDQLQKGLISVLLCVWKCWRPVWTWQTLKTHKIVNTLISLWGPMSFKETKLAYGWGWISMRIGKWERECELVVDVLHCGVFLASEEPYFRFFPRDKDSSFLSGSIAPAKCWTFSTHSSYNKGILLQQCQLHPLIILSLFQFSWLSLNFSLLAFLVINGKTFIQAGLGDWL